MVLSETERVEMVEAIMEAYPFNKGIYDMLEIIETRIISRMIAIEIQRLVHKGEELMDFITAKEREFCNGTRANTSFDQPTN